MKRINMKKAITIVVIIIMIVSVGIYKYKDTSSKYKDINYVVERYITSGIFNKYKLYKIDDMKLSFSDGAMAVMTVSGVEDKVPHKNIKYDVFLEKSKKGLWKVKKIYPQ